MLLRTLFGLLLSAAVYGQGLGSGEYGGPSVLSRGLSPSVLSRNATVSFRPYITLNGICDTGLTGARIDANGHLSDTTACGAEVNAGIYGSHQWRQTVLGLQYVGNYRHYPNASYYDGIDQSANLELTHRFSKRVVFSLHEIGGVFGRNYQTGGVPNVVDSNSLFAPTAELFDNRVEYVSTSADAAVRLSSRWSFDLAGRGFVVRRQSTALYGTAGGGAQGDLIYRYSRFGSIGVAYTFLDYSFTKAFGSSAIHSAALIYSVRLSKVWELRLRGGASRVESLGVEFVAVDPVVAAITGQNIGVRAAYHINYISSYGGDLTRAFQHGGLIISFDRGVTPGNGVYLTSAQEGGAVSYNYTGVRRWNVSASAGYSRMIALIQTLPDYRSYAAGLGVVRDLGKGLGVVWRVDGRRYEVGSASILQRGAYRVTLGLSWSPGDVPLMLW